MIKRKYEFRAITMDRKGEDINYSSVPIQEAVAPYLTVGFYKNVKEGESYVQKHIADMSIEESYLKKERILVEPQKFQLPAYGM